MPPLEQAMQDIAAAIAIGYSLGIGFVVVLLVVRRGGR